MAQEQIVTKVRPTGPDSFDDELIHQFCRCGAHENPMRARCGKVKQFWNDVDWEPDPSEECRVCEELKEMGCRVCGA